MTVDVGIGELELLDHMLGLVGESHGGEGYGGRLRGREEGRIVADGVGGVDAGNKRGSGASRRIEARMRGEGEEIRREVQRLEERELGVMEDKLCELYERIAGRPLLAPACHCGHLWGEIRELCWGEAATETID